MPPMRMGVILLLVLIVVIAGPAQAQRKGPLKFKINPEVVIGQCWDISEERRASAAVEDRLVGYSLTARCLEEAVVANASMIMRGNEYTVGALQEKMRSLGNLYGGLYTDFTTRNRRCSPSCEDWTQIMPLRALARLYEDMLRDIVAKRNRYGY